MLPRFLGGRNGRPATEDSSGRGDVARVPPSRGILGTRGGAPAQQDNFAVAFAEEAARFRAQRDRARDKVRVLRDSNNYFLQELRSYASWGKTKEERARELGARLAVTLTDLKECRAENAR